MTPREGITLSPQELAIKRATREAVLAAGGQSFVAQETGRAQSCWSDYCSDHTATFIPADMIARVEQLGQGSPGHPHITRALARQAGAQLVFERLRGAGDAARLGEWMAALARENADVTVALADCDLDALASDLAPRSRARLAIEAEQQMAVLRRLLAAIDGCAAPVARVRAVDSS